MNENITIRKFLPQDRAEIRRISCETSFLEFPRQEILADDEIIADSLTAYFMDHEPESCFVAVLTDGKVVGYLTGSKNIGRMHKVEFRMLISLIAKAFKKGLFVKPASWKYFYYSLRSLFRGEFIMPDFSKSYPAVLHINIDKPYRGAGIGEKLIDTYLNYLKEEGVSGVHFGTFSEQAKGFFLKMGFDVIFQSKRTYLKPYTGADANFYIFGRKFIEPSLIKADNKPKITLKQRIIMLLDR
ncbi:GNAT family N-acetyltransferase, partial [bacterium]